MMTMEKMSGEKTRILAVTDEGRVIIDGEHTGYFLENYGMVGGKLYQVEISPASIKVKRVEGREILDISSDEEDQLGAAVRHVMYRDPLEVAKRSKPLYKR